MTDDLRPDYGILTDEMIDAIRSLVQGKTVVDLGAGICAKARFLKGLGARIVIAVDRIDMPPTEGVERMVGRFEEVAEALPDEIDVGFMAWPQNYEVPGLVEILGRCKVVIYVGNNFDGHRCGFAELFEFMLTRTLLHNIGLVENSLVIVGDKLDGKREPTLDEKAGMTLTLTPCPF
tara:strand:+ start:593 stop:1123 length:531 start_codon:yes stop_codon:yes gene_type:complete